MRRIQAMLPRSDVVVRLLMWREFVPMVTLVQMRICCSTAAEDRWTECIVHAPGADPQRGANSSTAATRLGGDQDEREDAVSEAMIVASRASRDVHRVQRLRGV
jgi:hypothetical protein